MKRILVGLLVACGLTLAVAESAEARCRGGVRGAVRGVGAKAKAVVAKVLPPYRDRGCN